MAKPASPKRTQIDKANARMVGIIAAASFITVFSLVAMKSLWSQASYQQRVIDKKEAAVDTLKKNVEATQTLVDAFKQFNDEPSVLGNGDKNAKIVLDALPSKYDFPALASSLEKILTAGGYRIESITGTDDEVNQETATDSSQPVDMPFSFLVTSNYQAAQKLVLDMERSIRPFNFQKMELTGNDAEIKMTLEAKTFFLPEKSLEIKTEVVK
jgi:Tfp pilus assembly protein PilO